MFRFKIIPIGIGIFLGFLGYEEYSVSHQATIPATKVELSEIEASTELSNNFIQIGKHWSIYPATIYEYQMEKYETGDPDENTTVNYAYYPVVSEKHPYLIKIDALFERYGDEASIPENEWPEFRQFSVLVKTKRYKKIGSIPEDWEESESLEGLVINRIKSLNSEEEALLRQSFPQINLNEVLILEEGRLPSSKGKSIGLMSGGGLLILVGLMLLLQRKS